MQQIELVSSKLEKTCFRLNVVAQKGAAATKDVERLDNMVKNLQDAIAEYQVCPPPFCHNYLI